MTVQNQATVLNDHVKHFEEGRCHSPRGTAFAFSSAVGL